MPLTKIETPDAPKAIGPYSQGVSAQGFVFVSGQLPIDAATGSLVEGDIGVLTARVLENIRAVLSASACGFENVVRTDVFLTDLNDFAAMNEVYASYFTGNVKPARVTVEVKGLPRDSKIEISCIAVC